ncbi:family 43 glycosylhydrolase [Microbacterium rhizomatis]|uniref:Family 43 glycosylhydrolase n=1 Tax=Microbacterium rhizomatis TaxID=1631477 RepID=A0A5J5IX50_9MICO|nr:family 43 glycosylhydrolase [Microbacterium rhizomatis]KAA9105870.1 family 43 glycosylhydrolase [Microbacterium rhizomatis]
MQQQAVNPYLPDWEYIPDGEPRIFGDRVFLFGSHDRFSGRKYCMNDYVAWSAPVTDLSDWSNHGVMYRKEQDPGNRTGKRALWAPDVVQGGDGRFYLYYGLEFVPRISVAVADAPEGPYEFLGYVTHPGGPAMGSRPGDPFPFDPGVLVDDDGQAYLYFGFGMEGKVQTYLLMGRHGLVHEGAYVVALEPDMHTIAAGPRLIVPKAGASEGTGFEGHEFYEAASIRKIADTYYFVYSSIQGHELCYATSDRPTEGFKYRGVLVSNGDIGLDGRTAADALNYTANNHGGLVQIENQWYIFYHRHTNREQVSRQAVAEPIELAADGRFLQTEMTSSGLNNGPLIGEGTYPARIACILQSARGAGPLPYLSISRRGPHPYFTQTGHDREGGGDQHIANMRDGAVAGFKHFDLRAARSVTVDVRGGDGEVHVSTELNGAPLAVIPVPTPVGETGTVALPEGLTEKSALYFRYRGKGAISFHSFTLAPEGFEPASAPVDARTPRP